MRWQQSLSFTDGHCSTVHVTCAQLRLKLIFMTDLLISLVPCNCYALEIPIMRRK